MDIQKMANTHHIDIRKTLEWVPVNGELSVFSLNKESKIEPALLFKAGKHLRRTCGFCKSKELGRFISGEVVIPSLEPYHFVTTKFLELMRTNLWFGSYEDEVVHADFVKEMSKDPLVDFVATEGDLSRVVQLDCSSHMMFNLNGEVLPVGRHCDYIDFGMHNENYHLDKALEILQANPNVKIIPDRFDDEVFIQGIPSYNRSRRRTHFINFIFSPTKEQVNAMWKVQQKDKKFPSCRWREAMFELDVLGLRAGGAAKHNTFYAPYKGDEDD